MRRSLVELESIVRNQICAVCTERTVDRQCGLAEPAGCARLRPFPQVALTIQPVKSSNIQSIHSGGPPEPLRGLLQSGWRWLGRTFDTQKLGAAGAGFIGSAGLGIQSRRKPEKNQ